uniref:(northern house mosquito) hypothetical protein n=1 Tax=Culex pipiens TaxID=7175 RepID=A0A8D8DV96_CULPI
MVLFNNRVFFISFSIVLPPAFYFFSFVCFLREHGFHHQKCLLILLSLFCFQCILFCFVLFGCVSLHSNRTAFFCSCCYYRYIFINSNYSMECRRYSQAHDSTN